MLYRRPPQVSVLIRDYLLAHGEKVYTQMLIDHFNPFCEPEQRAAEFEMLKTIAVVKKSGEGGRVGRGARGVSVLRGEYRPPCAGGGSSGV